MLFICCLHIAVVLNFIFYQVKLNLRSKRSVICHLKSAEANSSTDNSGLRNLVFDWFLYSVPEI